MIAHNWIPLQNRDGKRCIIWEYEIEDARWAVYRFVWSASSLPQVTFYVGSTLNLSAKNGNSTSLAHQYRNGARKGNLRLPMEKELHEKGGVFWTEILEIADEELRKRIDVECQSGHKQTLESVENFFIYQSFQEYILMHHEHGGLPFRFYNRRIDKLSDILRFM